MTQIRLRQDTATNWSSSSSITPALGEPCIQTDGEKYLKIGDGTNKFNNLPYFVKSTELGDLDDLTTENKDTFVDAINEIVTNGGNKDLSNLTTTGENKLQAVKAYASNGEMLHDADGLAFVNKYAHSTFDLSKFTVVGSPIITDNGIASGFSGYTDILKFNLNLDTAGHEIKIKGRVKIGQKATTGNESLFKMIKDGTEKFFVFKNTAGAIQSRQGTTYRFSTTTANYAINEWLDYEVTKTKDSKLSLLITQNNSVLYNLDRASDFTESEINEVIIGEYSSDIVFDLKQFSITVDGVEVFSGNKTGIDTIKPDDYTVVGTPTISDDGVASNFSSTSYIYKNITYTNQDSFGVDVTFPFSKSESSLSTIFITNEPGGFRLFMEANGNIGMRSDTSGVGNLFWVGYHNLKVPDGTIIRVISKLTSTTKSTQIYTDGVLKWDSGVLANSWLPAFTALYISRSGNEYSKVPLDLNLFKFYKNDSLVYQPCLKIPYTESKTGSKIVDAYYRDRVADMSAQFGYAPYYTLSDTDFTLPQVELYGLIGAKTLRDSYENGINKWYLYSNRDLEQQGSCTSGVEVTLARPFADTNYVLSVPYSAKSTTAFTPTQTGDWIAKGKGVL